MDKIQLSDKDNIDTGTLSNEELRDLILELSDKVDKLKNQLKTVENKIDRLQLTELTKSLNKDDVEIEEQSELEEDYLTPPDILFENEALQKTGMTLISLRIATASEIARKTKKDRAVESLYLNDLWNRNKVRKLRIGRAVYFYIGRPNEIIPFKNPFIKPEWRDPLICIFRSNKTFFEPGKIVNINLNELVRDYCDLTQYERIKSSKLNDQSEQDIIILLKDIFESISIQSSFLKFDPEKGKIDFFVDEWLKLA